jgi:hypothetical protein
MTAILKFPIPPDEELDDVDFDDGDGGDGTIKVEITVLVDHRYPKKVEVESSGNVGLWIAIAALAVMVFL